MVSLTIPYEKSILRYQPNWLLCLLGFKAYEARGRYEFAWGVFSAKWTGPRLMLLQFSSDHDYPSHWTLDISLGWGAFWINLPRWLPKQNFGEGPGMQDDSMRHWGFRCESDYLILQWKHRYHRLACPWAPVHVRHQVLGWDGVWRAPPDRHRDTEAAWLAFEIQRAKETYPYRYRLNSGTLQDGTATISVEEREWRPKWTQHLPIFRHTLRSIAVRFANGMGERADSWKGGVTGCSWEMRYDETPHEALLRMERTRRFD